MAYKTRPHRKPPARVIRRLRQQLSEDRDRAAPRRCGRQLFCRAIARASQQIATWTAGNEQNKADGASNSQRIWMPSGCRNRCAGARTLAHQTVDPGVDMRRYAAVTASLFCRACWQRYPGGDFMAAHNQQTVKVVVQLSAGGRPKRYGQLVLPAILIAGDWHAQTCIRCFYEAEAWCLMHWLRIGSELKPQIVRSGWQHVSGRPCHSPA